MALQVLLLLLVPYALPLLMPSWRWLLAYAVAVAVLFTVWFTIWFHAVMTAPTRTGLEGIGLVFVALTAIPTAAGTVVRMVTLMVEERHQYSGRYCNSRLDGRCGANPRVTRRGRQYQRRSGQSLRFRSD